MATDFIINVFATMEKFTTGLVQPRLSELVGTGKIGQKRSDKRVFDVHDLVRHIMAASGARPYRLTKELSFAVLRQLCCPLAHHIVLDCTATGSHRRTKNLALFLQYCCPLARRVVL